MIADDAVRRLCIRREYMLPEDSDHWTALDFVIARLASYVNGAEKSLRDVPRNDHDMQLAAVTYTSLLLAFEAAVSEVIRNSDRIHEKRW